MELEVTNTTQLELEVQHSPTENTEVAESDRMKDAQHHPMEVRVVHMAYKSLTSNEPLLSHYTGLPDDASFRSIVNLSNRFSITAWMEC